MSKRGGKTKSGEPELKESQDKGDTPLIQESPNSGRDVAVKSPAEDGVQSEQADGREEVDGGGRSSQASEENSTPNKKKKAKKGSEGEQKDGVMEGAERQPKRYRSASFFNKLKKRSHGSQPVLSPNEAQRPQRRHTHSEGRSESGVFTNVGSTSRDGIKKISVDSQGAGVSIGLEADLQLQVEQLTDVVKDMKSEKYKEIETLRAEYEHKIDELQEQNARQRDQIKELLEQQKRQEAEKVSTQKEVLDNECMAQEERESHQMVVTELETLKKELEGKQSEVEKLRKEIETAKDRYANEMKFSQAEHDRVLTELRQKTEQTLLEKENDWHRKNKQMEKEIAELNNRLETQTMKLYHDKDNCTLPSESVKDEIQKLKSELEKAQVKLEESKVDLAVKDKEVDRLNRELENAEAKYIEELQTELERKDAQHAEEMDNLKGDYEEKRKQDEQLKEQQVQKEVNQLERLSSDKRLKLKSENDTLKEKLEQKEYELMS